MNAKNWERRVVEIRVGNRKFKIDEDDYHIIVQLLEYVPYREAKWMKKMYKGKSNSFVWKDMFESNSLEFDDETWLPRMVAVEERSSNYRVCKLRLSCENFQSLPRNIGNLTGLTHFWCNIWGCKYVTQLPKSFFKLRNLQVLDLHLPNILALDLSNTKGKKQLPGEAFGSLPNLVTLVLRSSCIKSLPPSIDQFQNLKFLDLGHTKNLLALPNEVGNLVSLRSLNLLGSNISSLPTTIGQLRNLEMLDLSCTDNLLVLPNKVGNLVSLRSLNLYGSKITTLPATVGKLRNLEILVLSATKNLLVLPNEVGNLVSLRSLNLLGSKIISLPTTIGQLQNLEILDLCNTENLSSLPDQIGNLKNLKSIRFERSGLASLPDSVRNLTSLEVLGIYGSVMDRNLRYCGRYPVLTPVYGFYKQLAKCCPFLGMIDDPNFRSKTLSNLLARNRARCRMGLGSRGQQALDSMPTLWPLVLHRSHSVFSLYRHYDLTFNRNGLMGYGLTKVDAIHQLLTDGMGPFLVLLINETVGGRNART